MTLLITGSTIFWSIIVFFIISALLPNSYPNEYDDYQ
jgi:hypothetical protein